MSWFTDIAGKAETFLNKIDQNAAVALNQAAATIENNKSSRKSSPRNSDGAIRSSATIDYDDMFSTRSSNPNHVISSEHFNGNGTSTTSMNDSLSISISQPEDFIPSSPRGQKKINETISVITVQEKTKPSSKSKSAKSKDGRVSNTNSPSKPTANKASPTPIPVLRGSNKKGNEESELMDFLNDPNRKDLDENLVLQTELANQAREVELLYKTNKQLQSDNETLKAKVARYEQNKSQESRVEEIETQLRQGENVQKNLKKLLAGKDEEIVKLKKSLDQTLERLQQLEVLQSTQNRLEVVENENQKLINSNEELREQVTVLNDQILSSENQMSSIKSSLTTLESEFNSYKEKAKSILKQKDELLTSLQEGTHRKPNGAGENDGDNQYLSEINALKSERELLNAEISQCRATTDSLREETHRLESELSSLRSLNSLTQKQLNDEKSLSSTLQDENLQLRQQLSSSQFELDLEKSEKRKLEEWKTQKNSEDNQSHSGRISPVDNKKASNNSFSNGDTEENLRMRITALSQSLLEKQSLINNLSSDKQLLQINVERLLEQVRDIGNEQCSSNNSGFSHTVISNRPLYLSESPWDSGMSTGVKRAFSTVDSLCCQAGLALRRRPNLRLGFCVYILLLHFWVLFILFHSFSHVPHFHEPSNGNGAGPAPGPVTGVM